MGNISKLIIATGISGCDRKEYLSKWEHYARNNGKKIKVFHTGKMMFEHAREIGLKLNTKNILHADRDLLDVLRSAVFNGILGELSTDLGDYDAVVICVHAFFDWHDHFIRAYDKLLRRFSPDMYITFINDHSTIIQELKQREQWRDEKLSEERILKWQGLEVEATAGFADISNKPFFAVPVTGHQSIFYRLVFHPEIETVYSAMPISHFPNPEERKVIDKFVEELDKYFVVFNPLSIETIGAVKVNKKEASERSQEVISNHVIYRDIDWFVRQVDKVVVFWPEKPVPKRVKADPALARLWPRKVPSPGINHEMHAAFSKTGDVWVVCLGKEISPFTSHHSTKLFGSTKEFFDFLEKCYPDRRKEWIKKKL